MTLKSEDIVFEDTLYQPKPFKYTAFFFALISVLGLLFLRGDLRVVESAISLFGMIVFLGMSVSGKRIVLKNHEILSIEYDSGNVDNKSYSVKISDSIGYFTYKTIIDYTLLYYTYQRPSVFREFRDWRDTKRIYLKRYGICIKFPNNPVITIEDDNKNKIDHILQTIINNKIKNYSQKQAEYEIIFTTTHKLNEECEKIFNQQNL